MKPGLRTLHWAAVLFWILSNQIEVIAASPQASPGQADLQSFLTARHSALSAGRRLAGASIRVDLS